MGKLLRRNNKSPDAEQLLTPRKQSGFFGKRNNGVRSEDNPDKPPKTLKSRLETVFKSSTNNNNANNKQQQQQRGGGGGKSDEENHPLDDSPALVLGTPKTAPPSPDNDNDKFVDLPHHLRNPNHHNRHHNQHHYDGSDSIVSDLTGTVSPPSHHKNGGPPIAIEEKASGMTPPTAGMVAAVVAAQQAGVTFAADPKRSESFYSAYSPPMDVFRTDSGNVINIGSDYPSGNYHTTPPSASRSGTLKTEEDDDDDDDDDDSRYCKPTVLDQVLGAVDGACQRSMDLTLGSQWSVGGGGGRSITNGSSGKRRNIGSAKSTGTSITREWGTAPSADDDDSTCIETRADTFITRDTSTYAPRESTICASTPSCGNTTSCTGTTLYGVGLDETVASTKDGTGSPTPPIRMDSAANSLINDSSSNNNNNNSKLSPSSPTSKEGAANDNGAASSSSLVVDTKEETNNDSDKQAMKRVRSGDLHENFELVLGQTGLTFDEKPSKEEQSDVEQSSKKSKGVGGWAPKILHKSGDSSSSIGINKKRVEEEEKKEEGKTEEEENLAAITNQDGIVSAQFSPSAKAAAAAATTTKLSSSAPASPDNLTKLEKRQALFQSVFGDDFATQDIGVEIQSSKILKEQEEARLRAGGKPPHSPSSKKVLSGLVKRLRFGKLRRNKSTSSIPPKRATGTFNDTAATKAKNAGKTTISNNKNGRPDPVKRGTSSTAALPPPPPKPPLSPKTAAINKAATQTPMPPTPTSSKTLSPLRSNEEEEKKEFEETLETTFITDNTSNVPNSNKEEDAAAKKKNEEAKSSSISSPPPPASVSKAVPSEIKGLPAQPGPLKARCSNSFRLPKDPLQPKSNKTLGSSPEATTVSNDDGNDNEDELADSFRMGRLRSAPVKVSSQELLAESQKAEMAAAAARRKPPKLTWKSATDDQGRTYYYHRETRKTQWVKPPEFDAEVAAVKKYKEDMEAAKKEASETQQVVDGYKNVEAIQAQLRKKTKRDFDPKVWQTKQEILDIVRTMPLPQGTNIEKLLIQYDGREEQLLANLRDLVESKPFDEPFQAPKDKPIPLRQHSRSSASTSSHKSTHASDPNLNLSHASSSGSSSVMHAGVDVQQRIRTAVSASTRISEKTYLTEKTQKVSNTSDPTKAGLINTIREGGSGSGTGTDAMSTGSISSASNHSMPVGEEDGALEAPPRIPSKIPAVPRSRDLKVEEFTNDRIAKETFNGECVVPPTTPTRESTESSSSNQSGGDPCIANPPGLHCSAKAVAEHIVALSSLDDDDDSYNGDYEETVNDNDNDTESEKMHTDSISALSEADVDYLAQKENFERARRRALDVAVEREDWDLAAALSEGMRQVKESLYGKPAPQREWTQTELDRFISENDWDAVSKYIAHMRDHSLAEPSTSSAGSAHLPHLSTPRGVRDPETGRDPDGYSPSTAKRMSDELPPPYHLSSEASKRATNTHNNNTHGGRSKQRHHHHSHTNNPLNTSLTGSHGSSQGSKQRAQTRFGARSQLQHSDLTSMSSWGESSSSYDSEYSDNSYESEEDHGGYISLRVRRNEFQC